MKLHHYYLRKPNSQLTLSENSIILKFTKNTLDTSFPKNALYVTTESLYDSDMASQLLSITYYPKYDAIIDVNKVPNIKLVDNQNKPLCNPLETMNITRVWPAFGKIGGSHECIIIAPIKIKATVINLANGGAPDRWHQDVVENYNLEIVKLIATGIVDALETSDLGFHSADEENYFVKAVKNSIVTNSLLNDKNMTLSAAWKNLKASPEFKFWACLWKDKEHNREVLHPYSEKLNIGIIPPLFFGDEEEIKKCLKSIIKNRNYVFLTITETIKSLLNKIILVSDEFFECHSHKIIIPP